MDRRKKWRGIVIFGLIAVISVVLLYFSSGAPSLSPEMAMHRQESRRMIGPSEVIAGAATGHSNYDSFLLGETEYGYCVYEYNDGFHSWDGGLLTYAEKQDTVTILPVSSGYMWYGGVPGAYGFLLPVFVISENDRAVSAKLTLTAEYGGIFYEVSETADLEQSKYFLFQPDVDNIHSYVREFWYRKLKDSPNIYAGVSGGAKLELFDRQGILLETLELKYAESQ